MKSCESRIKFGDGHRRIITVRKTIGSGIRSEQSDDRYVSGDVRLLTIRPRLGNPNHQTDISNRHGAAATLQFKCNIFQSARLTIRNDFPSQEL